MTQGRSTVYAGDSMIATPHYLASEVGLSVLRDGGNAIDAAIAANAVLNVMAPNQCHMGGDLFALVWDQSTGELAGLNASGPAPREATIDDVKRQGHTTMPQRGALSVTVPGTVAGWASLLDRYGTWGFDRLLEPAAIYAERGVPYTANFTTSQNMHRWLLAQDAAASKLFSSDRDLRPGVVLKQERFAATLRKVGKSGPDGFYCGEVADDIVSTLQSGGSKITHDDLSNFAPEWVEPLKIRYKDAELVEMPPNSQGPAALLLAGIAEGWDLKPEDQGATEVIHKGIEAVRSAFLERDAYITDPRYSDVPLSHFMSEEAVQKHRAAIDPSRAGNAVSRRGEDGDTVYLCVVDRDGLAVSLIQSVYMGFGSGVVAPESGVLFQNRGHAFSLDPSHANALEGGKRPRHTLIPAMLLRDGRPSVVFGAMGGDGQAQTHLQLLQNIVDFGNHPQEAIDYPRWLVSGDVAGEPIVIAESRFDAGVLDELTSKGHTVERSSAYDQRMGHAQMIHIDHDRGVLAGGADSRGDGVALGW